jgi:hypothetical protein
MFPETKAAAGAQALTTLQPYVSRLSRQYGILNVSQPFKPPRPVPRIALLIYK